MVLVAATLAILLGFGGVAGATQDPLPVAPEVISRDEAARRRSVRSA